MMARPSPSRLIWPLWDCCSRFEVSVIPLVFPVPYGHHSTLLCAGGWGGAARSPALSLRELAMLVRPRASIPGLANPEAAKAAEGPARARSTSPEHPGSIRPWRSPQGQAHREAPLKTPALGQCVFYEMKLMGPETTMHTGGESCAPRRAGHVGCGTAWRRSARPRVTARGSRPGARADGAGACAGGRAASAPRRGCLWRGGGRGC